VTLLCGADSACKILYPDAATSTSWHVLASRLYATSKQLVASQCLDILLDVRTTFLPTWRCAGMLICRSVVLLVAIGNDVLVDHTLVGSINFGGTQTPHRWNSGGMLYDVVMVLERRNDPRQLRDHDEMHQN